MPEGLDKQKVLLSSWSERSSATNWNGSVPKAIGFRKTKALDFRKNLLSAIVNL